MMYSSKYILFIGLCAISITVWGLSFTDNAFVFPLYGIAILLYIVHQVVTSSLNSRHTPLPIENGPSVSILVVGYRENPVVWTKCLDSIKMQNYLNIKEIVVSIDDDKEEDQLMYDLALDLLYDDCLLGICVTIMNNPHGGKRSAMSYGFEHIIQSKNPAEFIIVTDSDTILDSDATGALVACIDSDEMNGCATGVLNVNTDHIVGKIVNARYAYAFNIERASMSYSGVVNCCSGPLSIYRTSLFTRELLDSFIHQECCGEICGPGDDRHLTCLTLLQG